MYNSNELQMISPTEQMKEIISGKKERKKKRKSGEILRKKEKKKGRKKSPHSFFPLSFFLSFFL